MEENSSSRFDQECIHGNGNPYESKTDTTFDNDSCSFLDIPSIIFERICGFLNLNELPRLSQSCKVLDRLVGEYLRHKCCSSCIVGSYREFVRKYRNLATLKERRIMQDIDSQLG